MSDWLMVQNAGVAPLEGLTLFGASLTRKFGSEDTIGQFGSGSKHAVSVLLRNGIPVIFYLGNLRLEWFTESLKVKDELNEMEVPQVCVRITGKDEDGRQINRTEKLGWTLGFGSLDWDEVAMALREFVSNALDRSIRQYGNYDNVEIAVTEKEPRAKSGHTRIFVQAVDPVVKYVKQLPKRFLHFGESENIKTPLLEKRNRATDDSDKGCVYRCGVFVRNLDKRTLFDYNFDKRFKIDESRNAADYTVHAHMVYQLFQGDDQVREKVLKALTSREEYYEFTDMPTSTFKYYYDADPDSVNRYKKEWVTSFNAVYGPTAVLSSGVVQLETLLRNKGYTPVFVPYSGWRETLEWFGVKTEASVLNKDELAGKEIIEPTEDCKKALLSVWNFLGTRGVLNGKSMPDLKVFKKITEGGSIALGEYRDNVVYIGESISMGWSKMLWQTMLEEVTHHVTGAADNSRDLQEFLFQVITDIGFQEV